MTDDKDKPPVITYIETTTPPEPREREWRRIQQEAIVRAVIEAIRDNEDLRRELLAALGIQENNQ